MTENAVGSAQAGKTPRMQYAPNTLLHDLNTDTSLDTIFWGVLAGAATYGVARSGLEFTPLASAGIATVVGTGVFLQYWQQAVMNVFGFTAGVGTVTRNQPKVN